MNMALKETVNVLKRLLEHIGHDLEKAVEGNKAASQRVRTHSIEFEKTAKVYRKESIAAERKEVKILKPSAKKGNVFTEAAMRRPTAKLPSKKK